MYLLEQEVDRILDGRYKTGSISPLWEGKIGEKITEKIVKN